jgi:hypothetical protein
MKNIKTTMVQHSNGFQGLHRYSIYNIKSNHYITENSKTRKKIILQYEYEVPTHIFLRHYLKFCMHQ